MSLPRVYGAINAVALALAERGIAKRSINLEERYAYRSVDDVYNEIGPLLAAHKLCVLPRVIKRRVTDRADLMGNVLVHAVVRSAFDFVSVEDGSVHTVEAFGEALDGGDKATAKAMQSAYKYVLLQSFCVPLGADDADASSHRIKTRLHTIEPAEGWQQWTGNICELIRSCDSVEAIAGVQSSNRALLLSLSRERRELYETVGAAAAERRAFLSSAPTKPRPGRTGRRAPRQRKAAAAVAEAAHG